MSSTVYDDQAGSERAKNQPAILIAEDQSELIELYIAGLPDGYSVRTARDGGEALDLIDEEVDVALLDRQMPVMSGDEVLDSIRQAGYDCRVAMLTGVDPDFDILEMGLDAYLVKPVSIDELRDVVDRLLALATYDRDIQNYYALLSKKTALEDQKRQRELESNEKYLDLVAELQQLRDHLDGKRAELNDLDPRAMFDDLNGRT